VRIFLVGRRLIYRVGDCFLDLVALGEVLGGDGRVEFDEVVVVVGVDGGGAVG